MYPLKTSENLTVEKRCIRNKWVKKNGILHHFIVSEDGFLDTDTYLNKALKELKSLFQYQLYSQKLLDSSILSKKKEFRKI